MTLFDKSDAAGNTIRPSRHSEPRFDYLNTSGRTIIAQIRSMLENWFSKIGDADKKELIPRFRSRNDAQHIGAFFEIYMHELLTSMGYKVEFHPALTNGSTKRPDFLVYDLSYSPQFYLECTTVCPTNQMLSANSRLNSFYDDLNQLESPDFHLTLTTHGLPTTTPSGSRFRRIIQDWLETLDAEETSKIMSAQGYESVPRLPLNHEDMYFIVTAIPKPKDLRGLCGNRSIGGYMSGSSFEVTTSPDIKHALEEKANRYGKLSLPYIVAVNDWASVFDKPQYAMEALLGEEAFQLSYRDGGQSEISSVRKPNGAWRGPDGWRMKNVSAALIVIGLDAFSMSTRSPFLYHHPCPNNVLSQQKWGTPQCSIFEDKIIKSSEGRQAPAILGITEAWTFEDM